LSVDSISVAFGLISDSFSFLLGYNACIAPSQEMRNILEIISKINST
jgi:hypothetical protein